MLDIVCIYATAVSSLWCSPGCSTVYDGSL